MNRPWQRIAIAVVLAGLGIGAGFGLRSLGDYWVTLALLIAGAILAAVVAARTLRQPSARQWRFYQLAEGVSVSFFTLVFLLLILELVFRLFVARSDTLGYTLANQNWLQRYWKPINSLGYRDYEWTPANLDGKTRIMVLGDSFAAGFGIANIEDRFSGVLANELSESYAVLTVANYGWDTGREAIELENYPYPPDIVILAYYVNDIYAAARQHGRTLPDELNAVYTVRPIVWKSYLVNFLYFQIARLPRGDTEHMYSDFLLEAYSDPDIWSTHRAELEQIKQWCAEHGAALIVVVFPSLAEPERTAFATDRVTTLFLEDSIPVLDVHRMVAGRPPRTLIVNQVDAHPGLELSREVGLALAAMVREIEETSSSQHLSP